MGHLSNLSGLRIDRLGKVDPHTYKAHITELQRAIRDLQEEVRLAGPTGGAGQTTSTPAAAKQPFRFAEPSQATAVSTVSVQRALRTATQSRTANDHVTQRQLDRVESLSGGGGMDLTTDQSVISGDKDFGSLSFQETAIELPNASVLVAANLAGATVWSLYPEGSGVTSGPLIRGILKPVPDTGNFRILIWRGNNSPLRLAHMSGAPGVALTSRINTLSLTTADTVSVPQFITTNGAGAYLLYYDRSATTWMVIASRS